MTRAPDCAGFGFITLHDSDEEVFVHQVHLLFLVKPMVALGVHRFFSTCSSGSPLQSNIDTTGYRSLQQGEEVEFELVVGEDGKKKAFHVTGPQGTPPKVISAVAHLLRVSTCG